MHHRAMTRRPSCARMASVTLASHDYLTRAKWRLWGGRGPQGKPPPGSELLFRHTDKPFHPNKFANLLEDLRPCRLPHKNVFPPKKSTLREVIIQVMTSRMVDFCVGWLTKAALIFGGCIGQNRRRRTNTPTPRNNTPAALGCCSAALGICSAASNFVRHIP